MKKQILYKLYSAAFIGICLVPAVLMPFIRSDGSKENRALAEAPSLKNEDGSININYLSELGDYFSEHFAFRQQLVTADGRVRTALVGTSPNSDVIAGKDGWLYYGETADDFLNINTLSRREICGIAHDLRLIDEYCAANGAEFIFTSVPNKNSLYPEYMPANYVPADSPDNYELLSEELSSDGFYLDMKSALSSAGSSIPLYHKTDTHWNNMGAYAGHAAIMNKLGRDACPAGSGWHTSANARLGDLAAMIYPAEEAKDTQIYNDYEFTYTYTSRFRALDDITINTASESGEGGLLMFRDSFGEAILPYMAEQFAEAEFSRVVPYRLESAANGAADTVILEIVERNIPDLVEKAPVMAAPVTEPSMPASFYVGDFSEKENSPVIDWENIPVYSEQSGGYELISGELPENFFSGDSHRILLTVGDITYEAFCASEYSACGNGFSAYIPADTEYSSIILTAENAGGRAFSVTVPADKIIVKG